MIKKISSLILIIAMVLSVIPSVYSESVHQTAEAVYGTPVIDGEIDQVWDKTNYYTVTHCNKTGVIFYKGWFKVLWDENYIYVLAKEYTTQFNDNESDPWLQDSVDVYIDENMRRTKGYENGDYQLRCNFKNLISGNNYNDLTLIKSQAKTLDDSFIVEMAFPLETIKPHEGLSVGFEVLMTAAKMPGVEMREYLWNCTKNWLYNDTGCYGTLNLVKTMDVTAFNEPKFVRPSVTGGFTPIVNTYNDNADKVSLFSSGTSSDVSVKDGTIKDVTVKTDSKPDYVCDILHSDENPMMAIDDMAYVIGGIVQNGDTLVADGKSYKFVEGSPLAEDSKGHIMLDRAAIKKDGKMYIPAACIRPLFEYTFHYNRFSKLIKIHTGKDYPSESEFKVFYAKDYGAVGDGKTEDGAAITHALNAAMTYDGPATVMLEKDKTYMIEPKIDTLHVLHITDKNNLIFDGNGSTLMYTTNANQFALVQNCANVHIRNLKVDSVEPPFTYGVVKSVDQPNKKIRVEIPEDQPLPASNEWAQHFWKGYKGDAWWYTTVIDPVEDRIKWGGNYDIGFVSAVDHVEGRLYDLTMANQGRMTQASPGDRLPIFTRNHTYDVKPEYNSPYREGDIQVITSGDIYFENVDIYNGMWTAVNIGLCWGNVYLRDYGMLNNKEKNRIMANISDGVHTWRNRGGVIIEDCYFETNLDDVGNSKGEAAFVASRIDDYTYNLVWDQLYEEGDELIFLDKRNKKVISRAFVTKVVKNWHNNFNVTVDRKLPYATSDTSVAGVLPQNEANDNSKATFAWNVNATTIGTVVRNSTYVGGRRYPMLLRAPYSIMEDNKVYNCGAGFCASDEIFASHAEGSFPSFSTFRGNYTYQDDCIKPDYPLAVVTSRSNGDSTASIENFLIENNTIETKIDREAIVIDHVDGLYMYNNKLINPREDGIISSVTPIIVSYSRLADFDGLDFSYKSNVNAAVTFVGCDNVSDENVKNIKVNDGNTAKPYDNY